MTVSYSGRVQNDGSLCQKPINGICRDYVWLPTTGLAPSSDTEVAPDCVFAAIVWLDQSLEPVFVRLNAQQGATVGDKTAWLLQSESGQTGTSMLAARYLTRQFTAGGLNVQLKYFAQHDEVIAETNAAAVLQAAIDYFTQAYGPLPYARNLTMLELPASFSGGFAAGNISAMDESCLAAAGGSPGAASGLEGSGVDVLVHEIAHQWWGLATYPLPEEASNWSAEGITCYSTYRFLQSYLGEEYAAEHFLQQWQNDWATYRNAFYIQHPEYLAKLSAADAANVLRSFQTMRWYSLMPLQLLQAEDALGGPQQLQARLAELYQSHRGRPISYQDFLQVIGLEEEVLELE